MIKTKININKNQQGFSLIELMVGMIIGLLTTLVIMQVFSVFEGQKRTTSGTADAQTNGSVGLYSLQRDVQLAGFGLPLFDDNHKPLNCTSTSFSLPAVASPAMSATNVNLVPITITDRANNLGGDMITVRYGASSSGGVPMMVVATTTGTTITLDTNLGCVAKDTVITVSGTSCNSARVKYLTGADKIEVSPAINVSVGADNRYNTRIACAGTWNDVTYSVSGTQLMRDATPDGVNNGTPIVDGIVGLQAQYGISNAFNQNRITQWVDASGAVSATQVKAVRVAIIARNGLLEKDVVASACSSTTAANPTGVCAWDATSASPTTASPAPSVTLTHLTDWNYYRYKVYESVIPLRNVVWAKDKL